MVRKNHATYSARTAVLPVPAAATGAQPRDRAANPNGDSKRPVQTANPNRKSEPQIRTANPNRQPKLQTQAVD